MELILPVSITGTTVTLTDAGIAIGSSGIANGFAQADIAEVLIYNRVLSSVEQQQIEAYLSAKYGITVAGGGTTVVSYDSSKLLDAMYISAPFIGYHRFGCSTIYRNQTRITIY
jgi:hypothetical protein